MRTFAVVNQKGGCGKTTTAINLAGVFAGRGYRTLLVDMDPQGHCALGLAIPEQRVDQHIGDAMLASDESPTDPKRLLWRVSRNLDLAPATTRLAALEAARGELAKLDDAERRLKKVLQRFERQYDICLIDCSPAIGMLAFNALVAADEVIIPVETAFFAMQGATKQVNAIKAIGKKLGVAPTYRLLATLHDATSVLSQDLLEELKRRFATRVIPVVIRQDHALKEAASFGQPVIEYQRESNGAKDYAALADWLIENVLKNASPQIHDELETTHPTISPAAASPLPTGEAMMPATAIAEPPVTSRAADVVQRTKKLHRAATIFEAKPVVITHDPVPAIPAPQTVPMDTPVRDPFAAPAPVPATVQAPVLKQDPVEIPRLFGVQVTPQGALFVQPVSIGQSVQIAGEFNSWQPERTPLLVNRSTGTLEALVPIPSGSWQYRLVVDGKWMPDPFNPVVSPNPFGGSNSVVVIPVQAQPMAAKTRSVG